MPKKRKRTLARPSEDQRAERREKDRKLMADAVDALRSSEGWKRWLAVRRSFHTYSLVNQCLIALQRPEATRVAGFKKWLGLSYAVRKGERAIWIWAPCPPSKKKLERWRRDGRDPDKQPKTWFRMVPVFDRSQVDPVPAFPGGPAVLDAPFEPVNGESCARFLSLLRRFAESIGYSFSIEGTPPGVGGFCDRRKKRVVVRPPASDFSVNAQVRVAVHEGAHALLDAERREDDPALTYAEEELVVECVAYSVCQALGLDTSGSSVPYVASWSKSDRIERYAALIDRLASRIEDALLGEPAKPPALEPPSDREGHREPGAASPPAPLALAA